MSEIASTPQPKQERFLSRLDQHRKILFKVANSYARTSSDREDLVQEITVQLWRAFDGYDERYPFSTWVYRVALNVAISFYRREARRRRHFVAAEQALLERIEGEEGVESSESDADLRLLARFLARLEELDRALLLLYLDGNRHREMAEILGISETNVATKIGRLKQRLRDLAQTA